jgi:hypothetical protein
MRMSVHRFTLLASAAVLVLTAAVSGQGRQPATPTDELLAEVRALRADINSAARSAMRGQLLGMRLQLQEQRIGVISRQLTGLQERRRANAQAQTALTAQLKMFPGMDSDQQDQPGFAQIVAPLKGQVAELGRTEQTLKSEEADLERVLAAEQSRWTAFNAQIEVLERAAAGASR